MLQAYIDRAKVLLNGKFVFPLCAGLLLTIGLAYFFINQQWGKGSQDRPSPISSEPAATNIQEYVVVDISGAVANPGIYKVPSDSRVGDAIALAGGLSLDASVQYVARKINLANKIEDSEKIYVPFELDVLVEDEYEIKPLSISSSTPQNSLPSGSSSNTQGNSSNGATSGSAGALTNVNSTSLSDLDKLAGIGPAYAQKIIDNRSYKDFIELVSKSGVPKATLEKIKDQLSY